jgi:hypothetical protein
LHLRHPLSFLWVNYTFVRMIIIKPHLSVTVYDNAMPKPIFYLFLLNCLKIYDIIIMR